MARLVQPIGTAHAIGGCFSGFWPTQGERNMKERLLITTAIGLMLGTGAFAQSPNDQPRTNSPPAAQSQTNSNSSAPAASSSTSSSPSSAPSAQNTQPPPT